MKILSIETSCDETAVAVLEITGGFDAPEIEVLGEALYSQASKHAEFGGVYPNLAKREHQQNLVPLLREVVVRDFAISNDEFLISKQTTKSKIQKEKIELVEKILEREDVLREQTIALLGEIKKPDIDAIAVTQGPGLEPALWVGLNFAKALSIAWNIPLVPVNHMEGHIVSVLLKTETAEDRRQNAESRGNEKLSTSKLPDFPLIALLVSGGHTQLVHAPRLGEYKIIGDTRDDAVGEAFDKVARLLGLPYPGGPQISALAEKSRKNADKKQINADTHPRESVKNPRLSASPRFPRPMIDSEDYDFSYSGLKTAVRYFVEKNNLLTDDLKMEIAREFEDAAIEVLISKTRRALTEFAPKSLIVGGGVIANKHLRSELEKLIDEFPNTTLHLPTGKLATDNAVMIGIAGALHFQKHPQEFTVATTDPTSLPAHGGLSLEK